MDEKEKAIVEVVETLRKPEIFADLYNIQNFGGDKVIKPESLVELKVVGLEGQKNKAEEALTDVSDNWEPEAAVLMKNDDYFLALFPVFNTRDLGIYFQENLRNFIHKNYEEFVIGEDEEAKRIPTLPMILSLDPDGYVDELKKMLS